MASGLRAVVAGDSGDLAKDPVEAPAVSNAPDLERWQREGSRRLAESKPAFAKSSRGGLRRGMPRSVWRTTGASRAYLLTPWSDF